MSDAYIEREGEVTPSKIAGRKQGKVAHDHAPYSESFAKDDRLPHRLDGASI